MEDLVRKIQSMTLTRTDAEIAEYILAHLSTIGFQTSTTMAEEIGVSDTSVIRFIRKLGFKGYADFRSEMNARPLMEIARESGAKVILMTDRRTSPLANKADVVVTAQVDGLGFTNSYVAPLSLSEVILLSVSGRKDVKDSKRFNRIDSVMEREKLY